MNHSKKAGVRGKDGSSQASSRERIAREHFIRRLMINAYRLLFGFFCFFLWEGVSGRLVKQLYISSPSAVIKRVYEWYATGFFFPHLWATLIEMALGFVLGTVLAILAGFLLGLKKLIAEILDPFLIAIWSVPGIILGPLFILYFGIGLTPKIILVATTVFFLVFFNTLTGIREVNPELVHSIKMMGADSRFLFRKVVLPSASLWIFTGLKNAIPFTIIGAVVGEMLSSTRGIGWLIERSSGVLDTTGVFAALFNLLVLGLLLNEGVVRLEAHVLRWKPKEFGATL
jgi:NitT/TauT family transport system permease protein